MMLANRKPILVLSLLIVAFSFLMAPAYATKPPDTLQMFGVGTRADAMGDAFVAVADDASATFWNPAGLTLAPNRQVAVVGKTLPVTNSSVSFTNANIDGFPSLADLLASGDTSSSSSGAEATFFAATMPLGRGVVGVSHALTGYANQFVHVNGTFAFDPLVGGVAAEDIISRSIGRIDQTAITYGWRPAKMLSAGLGVVAARAEFKSNSILSITTATPSETEGPPVLTTEAFPGATSMDGTAYGGTVGTLWTPSMGKALGLTFGASYVTRMSFSDLNGETGDRLLLGASCKDDLPNDTQATWSMQFSRYGSSDGGVGGAAPRSSVWDFYFGGQYGTSSKVAATANRYYQARYGMFTNRSPNQNVYGSENWLTLGLATGSGPRAWQAELALQHALRSNISLLSLSGDYRF
jgi:hypothetical protein